MPILLTVSVLVTLATSWTLLETVLLQLVTTHAPLAQVLMQINAHHASISQLSILLQELVHAAMVYTWTPTETVLTATTDVTHVQQTILTTVPVVELTLSNQELIVFVTQDMPSILTEYASLVTLLVLHVLDKTSTTVQAAKIQLELSSAAESAHVIPDSTKDQMVIVKAVLEIV